MDIPPSNKSCNSEKYNEYNKTYEAESQQYKKLDDDRKKLQKEIQELKNKLDAMSTMLIHYQPRLLKSQINMKIFFTLLK